MSYLSHGQGTLLSASALRMFKPEPKVVDCLDPPGTFCSIRIMGCHNMMCFSLLKKIVVTSLEDLFSMEHFIVIAIMERSSFEV